VRKYPRDPNIKRYRLLRIDPTTARGTELPTEDDERRTDGRTDEESDGRRRKRRWQSEGNPWTKSQRKSKAEGRCVVRKKDVRTTVGEKAPVERGGAHRRATRKGERKRRRRGERVKGRIR
jgi:hypothetical protein